MAGSRGGGGGRGGFGLVATSWLNGLKSFALLFNALFSV